MITRASLLNNTDIARLRTEREAKKVTKKIPSKGGKKVKKAASPTPSLDRTGMEGWGRLGRRWRLMSANLRVVRSQSWKVL